MMTSHKTQCRIMQSRSGFTLVEMLVAMIGSTIILASLTSTIYIALKASDTSLTPTQSILEGSQVLTELQSDLQYTLTITEQTVNAITVTVPDRNADSVDETIRFAWSGTAGDPLTRQYNGGTVVTLAEDVHVFEIKYIMNVSIVDFINIRMQISSDSSTDMETSITMLNETADSGSSGSGGFFLKGLFGGFKK